MKTQALAVVRRRAPGSGRRAACRRCAGNISALLLTALLIAVLLACPLMMLIIHGTTRSSSASHPRTEHQPTSARLSPSQMPVDKERSLR